MDDLQYVLIIKRNEELQNEIKSLIQNLIDTSNGKLSFQEKSITYQSITNKLVEIINQFELQPKLLEQNLTYYITELSSLFLENEEVGSYVGLIFYTFAKICSFKTLSLYFSSDVYLIEVLLQKCETTKNEFVKFTCLLWLCNLVLVPFPIASISDTLSSRLRTVGELNLYQYTNGSKIQKIASIFLSRLLTRSDCEEMIADYFGGLEKNWSFQDSNKRLGNLLVINQILKRKSIKLEVIYKFIVHDVLESNFSNMTLNYFIKILSKLANNFIQLKNFTQTCQIINVLLNDILPTDAIPFDINLRYCMAKSVSSIVVQLSYVAVNYQHQLIEFILSLLSSNDSNLYNIPKIQTTLLTLGYIALSKKLPIEFYDDCLNLATSFLFFKVQNGVITLGNQIRDSSCFLIWSIVKNMKNFSSILEIVFIDLLKALVFDEELILKKCSIAVLQELIGRFGKELIHIDDLEVKGEFIINFIEKLGILHLSSSICYQLMDEFYNVIDLRFLIEPLVDIICEQDGDGVYLNKLLIQPPQVALTSRESSISFDSIKYKLERSNRWHILFQLDMYSNTADEIFANFQYDESKQDMIKGYLTYLKIQQLNESQWHNLLKIIKFHDYTEEFRSIISNQKQIPISEVLYHLQNNEVLSKTLFDYKHFDKPQYDEIISMLKNPKFNASIRANLIENLSFNLPPFFDIRSLYDLFDDYTITDQGDVGSKIRINMVKLVQRNNIMDYTIRLKLTRLSGEIMDRLRNLAFKRLTNESFSWSNLFAYYGTITDTQMKIEFWKGIVFTCGSLVGNLQIINESFDELIKYKPTTEEFDILLSFLKPIQPKITSSRDQKLVLVTLQLILKLFDSNYNFSGEMNYNELFKKCYNLHINTKNLNRIKILLQIFSRIVENHPNLRNKIFSRYLWILRCHKMQEIKVFVGEVILFDIIVSLNDSEAFERYEAIDWFDINKSDIAFIESILKV
ncbi:hypothetical protein KGF54_002869 [Candida jiufengensis]|uniref:uncharacterized protein n=1 Tax=Candida jiufengensis TaxID=497108 RepID=UPI0022240E41|nr:uncharacterized protein KGF54_002869 [Candida jiufengensis]KAI5953497.1 hypothetical protein KGF54_002869 [Candida jiufengensis]